MIFFYYGPDGFRRLRKKQKMIAELRKKYPELVVENFSAADTDSLAKFLDFAKGQSLFSSKRLCELSDVYAMPVKLAKEIFPSLAERKDVAVFISEEKKPTKEFSFLLDKKAQSEEFEKMSGQDFLSFAKSMAKEAGLEASPKALEILAGVYLGDSWGVATEIGRLALFNKKIEEKDVEELKASLPTEYWPLVNSLKNPRLGARLWALFKLTSQGEEAAKTFNIVAALSKGASAKFAEYDILAKSGKLEYPELLLGLALG